MNKGEFKFALSSPCLYWEMEKRNEGDDGRTKITTA